MGLLNFGDKVEFLGPCFIVISLVFLAVDLALYSLFCISIGLTMNSAQVGKISAAMFSVVGEAVIPLRRLAEL